MKKLNLKFLKQSLSRSEMRVISGGLKKQELVDIERCNADNECESGCSSWTGGVQYCDYCCVA